MNPLDNRPGVRRILYIIQWVVNGVLTVAGAVFLIQGTATEDLPEWYVLTLGIAPVLWTYLGITAQSNVNTVTVDAPPPVEGG